MCVTTFQRPEGLIRLLASLEQLVFRKNENVDLEIIVIDNDPSGAGYAYCNRIAAGFSWPLFCHVETSRGISYARNKAIDCASERTNFIAFIDDDEVPEPAWLDELLYIQKTCEADVVTGPVLPYFNIVEPVWIINGKYFDRPRHQNGSHIDFARTGNVLVRMELFEIIGNFDERFALSGGEDTHFFMRVCRAGYKIVWADDAVVREWIPASRINIRWILQRGYRLANTTTICELDFTPLPITKLIYMYRGVGRVILGLLLLPVSLVKGRNAFVKALRVAFRGAGMISGVLGIHYKEYLKTHAP